MSNNEEQEEYLDIPFISPIHKIYDAWLDERLMLVYLVRNNKSDNVFPTIYEDLLEEVNSKIKQTKKEVFF
jgi:hypothetical protein